MSYSPTYVQRATIKQIENIWKKELFPNQWKQRDRWGEIYSTIKTKIPLNCSILDLGAGDEYVKKFQKHNRDYLSIDINGKCMLTHDFDYDLLDLWQYRAGGRPLPDGADRKTWRIGLCVEVLEYIKDPVRFVDHYMQYASTWIFTSRVARPDHIYEDHHPLQNRWRSHQEFINFFKQFNFSYVGGGAIETSLTTCSGKQKPFAMAVCEFTGR